MTVDELIARNRRNREAAIRGASQMVESILAIIEAHEPQLEDKPDVVASVFVHNFFASIEPNELDTPLQRAIKAEITERVFPSRQ